MVRLPKNLGRGQLPPPIQVCLQLWNRGDGVLLILILPRPEMLCWLPHFRNISFNYTNQRMLGAEENTQERNNPDFFLIAAEKGDTICPMCIVHDWKWHPMVFRRSVAVQRRWQSEVVMDHREVICGSWRWMCKVIFPVWRLKLIWV